MKYFTSFFNLESTSFYGLHLFKMLRTGLVWGKTCVTCMCQSTGTPCRWSTVTPRRHWLPWMQRGGGNNKPCPWLDETRVDHASSGGTSHVLKLDGKTHKCVPCVSQTLGVRSKATDHGKNQTFECVHNSLWFYLIVTTSVLFFLSFFSFSSRRKSRFTHLFLVARAPVVTWKFGLNWLMLTTLNTMQMFIFYLQNRPCGV